MKTVDSKRLLVVALNYAPELTGIGKYVGEMTEWLATRKIDVRVITAPPYYPEWSVKPGYSGRWYSREITHGCEVYRCPLWVPHRPDGLTRILHLLSFAISSLPLILWQALIWKPHVVFVVEPPLGAAPGAYLAAKLAGARSWLHVQDLEVDAAFELGLLRSKRLRRAILAVERWLMRRFDVVSNISEGMRAKLCAKGVAEERMVYFPNWVDVSLIRPLGRSSELRSELGINSEARVALYSGNMGEKQGLDVILEVARHFAGEPNVLFLLCGDGAARARIEQAAKHMSNVRLIPLQPVARFNELMNLADIHLLPQRAVAEDLVLPSKLGPMLASGRPIIASARAGSDVARVAVHGGIIVSPGDVAGFVASTRRLLRDEVLRRRLGAAGRAYALENCERERVLSQAFARLRVFAPAPRMAAFPPRVAEDRIEPEYIGVEEEMNAERQPVNL